METRAAPQQDSNDSQRESQIREGINRREFLRIAGIAGATIGLGTGMGGLLAACGSDSATTSTAGTPTTAAGAATSETAASTTTVSAQANGREIKIGYVSPLTGGLAAFGVPDQYCQERATEAIGAGLVCGDGQMHPVTIILRDSQSDSNRASQVAADLINNDKVDMMVAASTPDNVSPVADQSEAYGVPCLTTETPWQPYVATRSAGKLDAVFNWTYHVFWGVEDEIADFVDCWAQQPTNNVVGAMFSNDADGQALAAIWHEAWEPAGLTAIEQNNFTIGTEDFSSEISAFKKAGCEIFVGLFVPPDFTTFWKQAIQQSWVPKIPTFLKCLLFPQAVEAVGEIANNTIGEVFWSPAFPFTSPLLKQNCQEFADDFEAKTGMQWTQPLSHFVLFDWATDVLKRTKSVDDKNAIMDAVKTTNLETITGRIDFTAPVEPPGPPYKVGPCHIVENVYKTSLAGGQWRKSTKHPFELTIVSNQSAPSVAVQDNILPYTGS